MMGVPRGHSRSARAVVVMNNDNPSSCISSETKLEGAGQDAPGESTTGYERTN